MASTLPTIGLLMETLARPSRRLATCLERLRFEALVSPGGSAFTYNSFLPYKVAFVNINDLFHHSGDGDSSVASRRRYPRRAFMNILLILLLSTGAGRQFSVKPGGSNAADGSALHPWATIQHAADAVAAGDTVHVAPGQYNAAVSTSQSATAAARIRFISDIPWGAKITTGADSAWYNTGSYVDIHEFEFTGDSRIGILNSGNYVRIVGNHVYGNQNGSYGGQGGAGIDSGNYPSSGSSGITTGNQIIGKGR